MKNCSYTLGSDGIRFEPHGLIRKQKEAPVYRNAPYARSHQPGLNAFWTVQILATPTFRNTPVYFFVYESALSGQIEEGCEQLLIAVFS